MEPGNRFQGMNSASLRSLAGRYDNPIPFRFLGPKDCLKIPAQLEVQFLSITTFISISFCGLNLFAPLSPSVFINCNINLQICKKTTGAIIGELTVFLCKKGAVQSRR
jgi:hypothetical protein